MNTPTTQSEFDKFLQWEAASRDTVDFKKAYVDMADDLVAGLLLSQIVYWYLPGKDGKSKLRVSKHGYMWLAKQRTDWWDEVRITPRQFDRACKVLVEKGLIVKECFRFNGLRMVHLRIDMKRFMELWEQVVENPPDNPHLPSGESGLTQSVTPQSRNGDSAIDVWGRPLTETTAETTEEINSKTTAAREFTTCPDWEVVEAEAPARTWGGQDKEKRAGASVRPSYPPVNGYQALRDIGVSERMATQLSQQHSPADIQACIEEARKNDREKKPINNLAGYVVTLLKMNWPAKQRLRRGEIP
jgi:hypothetical protein